MLTVPGGLTEFERDPIGKKCDFTLVGVYKCANLRDVPLGSTSTRQGKERIVTYTRRPAPKVPPFRRRLRVASVHTRSRCYPEKIARPPTADRQAAPQFGTLARPVSMRLAPHLAGLIIGRDMHSRVTNYSRRAGILSGGGIFTSLRLRRVPDRWRCPQIR
jgi:hypothetical protein